MTTQAGAPSPALFMDTLFAIQRTAALKTAIELDLITALGAEALDAARLAARLGVPERGVRILCDFLTIMGFLEKDAGRYRATRDSTVFLNRESPHYLGGTVEFLLAPHVMEAVAKLTETVRKGTSALGADSTVAPDHPIWPRFARAMGALQGVNAEDLATLIMLPQGRPLRALDVSASHGLYGICLARKYSDVRVVALDWPSVLEVTRAQVAAAGLAGRFEYLAGNAFELDWGGGFDVILLPDFLHHFDRATCVQVLTKVRANLIPGGQVAIVEFMPNDDRITPPHLGSFAMWMLSTTPAGEAYTVSEMRSMLDEAGLRAVTIQDLPRSGKRAALARAG